MNNLTPNYDKGRGMYKPEAVVIHKCEGSFGSCKSWLCDEKSRVSAHYIISEAGIVTQLVDENDTAWHAGVIAKHIWKLLKYGVNPNSYTIGIELSGYAENDTPADQTLALAKLTSQICERWKIPIDDQHIVFHREIRGTKTCPGFKLSKDLIIFYAQIYIWLGKQPTA